MNRKIIIDHFCDGCYEKHTFGSINDFIIKSNYREFYKKHLNFYNSLVSNYKEFYFLNQSKQFLDKIAKKPQSDKIKNYVVAISPLVGGQNCHRDIDSVTTVDFPNISEDLILGKVLIPQKRIIKGVVSDDLGPVPGANVVVKNSGKSTTTDYDGNYSIEAEIGDEIVFSFASSVEKVIITDKQSNYNVVLKVVEIGQTVIITGGIKRRTFLGRQFQKIRNWFR